MLCKVFKSEIANMKFVFLVFFCVSSMFYHIIAD